MTRLSPLDSLFEATDADPEIPLPPELLATFGPLRICNPPNRPLVVANFVTTLDGVVDLNLPGHRGGGHISGFNEHDRFVMGLLRAIADVVVVGSGTFRGAPNHIWTAEDIYPRFKNEFRELRDSVNKQPVPLNVVVTASGRIDLAQRVFASGEVPVLIITTRDGASVIRQGDRGRSIQVQALEGKKAISAKKITCALQGIYGQGLILIEGGPLLIGDFLAERCLDELFLTLAPQIAGRDDQLERPGLVEGKRFAPGEPIWGNLSSVKRAGSHLLLRYRFT